MAKLTRKKLDELHRRLDPISHDDWNMLVGNLGFEKYIDMYDLIFNGAWECEMLLRPPKDHPYFRVIESGVARCYLGASIIAYGFEIVSGSPFEGISIGAVDNARKWAMERLPYFVGMGRKGVS